MSNDQIDTRVMTITPQQAEQLLATSPGNRRLNANNIKKLAHDMSNGRWLVTNQAIGIDRDGRLRDGHHRLSACMLANVPFRTLIVRGLDESTYEVTDTGMPRHIADRMEQSRHIAGVLSAAAALLIKETPSVQALRNMELTGLGEMAARLLDSVKTTRRYFSSSPFRLGASLVMLNDPSAADYAISQYRALCMQKYENMTPAAKSISSRAMSGVLKAGRKYETLYVAMSVCDPAKASNATIAISNASIEKALDTARNILTTAGARAAQAAAEITPKDRSTSAAHFYASRLRLNMYSAVTEDLVWSRYQDYCKQYGCMAIGRGLFFSGLYGLDGVRPSATAHGRPSVKGVELLPDAGMTELAAAV